MMQRDSLKERKWRLFSSQKERQMMIPDFFHLLWGFRNPNPADDCVTCYSLYFVVKRSDPEQQKSNDSIVLLVSVLWAPVNPGGGGDLLWASLN